MNVKGLPIDVDDPPAANFGKTSFAPDFVGNGSLADAANFVGDGPSFARPESCSTDDRVAAPAALL